MSAFHVDRDILIRATPETVWSFFTDSGRFALWWGEGSSIDPTEGGALLIRYPNGDTASGVVKELVERQRVVFTFGYDDAGKPIPPGGSLVTIQLTEQADGTLVSLRHDVDDEATRDMHGPGWRFQLSLFSKVACDVQHAEVSGRVDQWFEAWNQDDAAARETALADCADDDVHFADAYGVIQGRAELSQHIGLARMHMPLSLTRNGEVRHAQGTALVDWAVHGPDGQVMMRGTNVFDLAKDGRIARSVGIPQA